MIVLKSTLEKLQKSHNYLNQAFDKLFDRYNALVIEHEKLFGIATELRDMNELLLNQPQNVGFSQDEIRTLISLCHPDKHKNSDRSNLMTQRLLELRK